MATAAAASVPSWIRHCQVRPVLTGSELTLSFSSPASSSQCGFTSKSSDPWHDLIDRRQTLLNRRHDGRMAKSYDQLSLANPNSGYSNSLSKSNLLDLDGATVRRRPKFTELTTENLKILCSTVETRIPCHRDIALGIASAAPA